MLHVKLNILSWYFRLFLTPWKGGGFEVGPSLSLAVLLLSGFIPSYSSCRVYTYSVADSLMGHSMALLEDNHLAEKLLQTLYMNPERRIAWVQLWGDAPKSETKLLRVGSVGLLMSDNNGKHFSRWVLRVTLEWNLLRRGDVHLLTESFRQTPICKAVFWHTIVNVAYCTEVHLLRLISSSFFLFQSNF